MTQISDIRHSELERTSAELNCKVDANKKLIVSCSCPIGMADAASFRVASGMTHAPGGMAQANVLWSKLRNLIGR